MWRLVRAAYSHSMYQSFSIRNYMAVIRERRDLLKEAKDQWQKEEANEAEAKGSAKPKKKERK